MQLPVLLVVLLRALNRVALLLFFELFANQSALATHPLAHLVAELLQVLTQLLLVVGRDVNLAGGVCTVEMRWQLPYSNAAALDLGHYFVFLDWGVVEGKVFEDVTKVAKVGV